MEKKIRILGFAGSLRKQSFNKALLSAAYEIVPDNAPSRSLTSKESRPSIKIWRMTRRRRSRILRQRSGLPTPS